ncbi:dinitrogenase iron-molybdenum cofactor biosynthesis protein [Candidatus Thorarchaeota archaeon]|nr:MAG: dinitrogenase iron-molybdenum cofactor biosynthesis protein [Candidatus Thorarchaeota archaeon]
MKVAVSSTGPDMNSQVDPRFGRCPYFLIVDTDTMSAEAVQNTAAHLSGGAGIQAAQLVAQTGAKTVLTGSLGPNATRALAAAGLDTALGVSGTVKQALEQFKGGETKISTPSSTGSGSTYGAGAGTGMGYGMGRGRGGGRGGGRGMGLRRQIPTGAYPPQQVTPPTDVATRSDFETLKNQMSKIQEQLEKIQRRLDKLEK